MKGSPEKRQRNERIYRMWQRGKTQRCLSVLFGISESRAHQIVHREAKRNECRT